LDFLLEKLKSSIKKIGISLAISFVFVFCFKVDFVNFTIKGVSFSVPYPSFGLLGFLKGGEASSISIWVFNYFRNSLLPKSAEMITVHAPDAILALVAVSLFLALLISSPVIIKEFLDFIGPYLTRKQSKTVKINEIDGKEVDEEVEIETKGGEVEMLRKNLLPMALLFVSGVLMALFCVLPLVYGFLFRWAGSMGVKQFQNIYDFMSFTSLSCLSFGAIFQLPVLMKGLTQAGLTSPETYKGNFFEITIPTSIIVCLITPSDVLTYIMMGIVMGLYGLGYLWSKKVEGGD